MNRGFTVQSSLPGSCGTDLKRGQGFLTCKSQKNSKTVLVILLFELGLGSETWPVVSAVKGSPESKAQETWSVGLRAPVTPAYGTSGGESSSALGKGVKFLHGV